MDCYPHMLAPYMIRGVEFKNRVFASPVSANRHMENGYPTAEGIDAYETRARGGFAQVTLTETFVDHERSGRYDYGMQIYDRDKISGLHAESIKTLTEAIKAHGAVASVQLNHIGAVNHPDTIPGHLNPIGPSGFVREDGVVVEEMDEEMIHRVVEHFARSAKNCKDLGFDMVMLHGGHGWLLHQFISPRTNHRKDQYGGSMENRARFPIMVCDRIRELCGEDFLIEYRVSGAERVPGGMELEETIEFCKLIQEHVDLLHVTAGVYHSHVETKSFSSMFDAHGCNLDLAAAIKAAVHIPVVAIGGFNAPEQIEAAIASGKCDFVAVGRQQFADPDFVNKAMEGRADQIAPCLRCSCFNPMPSNPEERPMSELWQCAVNPWSGRELRWRNAPKPRGSRNVLVIGGGPGGLYAALTAAERGHRVTLVEQGAQLGGLLWFTDVDEHKESLHRYKDSLIARCRANGVKFVLHTKVAPEDIAAYQPDQVICAIGSHSFTPPVAGIEKASHVVEAYRDLEGLAKNLVIIGGGAIGCESGYFFATQGHKVHILEARGALCMESNDSQRRALLPRMEQIGMTYDCGVSVQRVTDEGVFFIKEGTQCFVPADQVLYACGNRANLEEARALRRAFPRCRIVGDAKKARTVKEAVYEGFCAGMDVL